MPPVVEEVVDLTVVREQFEQLAQIESKIHTNGTTNVGMEAMMRMDLDIHRVSLADVLGPALR